ncbi:ATP-dependent RNA helicase SUPV3L1, mitochondrial-like isoform X1 [Antedon mediterranea]|uniref:ATP-dependent RNA helicase SUPV3L1, mitochondrial-like isoform X1 n=2 Tax=Antedon mediterranea TaxID=105859 RepID=UPI003AF98E87
MNSNICVRCLDKILSCSTFLLVQHSRPVNCSLRLFSSRPTDRLSSPRPRISKCLSGKRLVFPTGCVQSDENNLNTRSYSNKKNGKKPSALFIPVPVKITSNPDDINIGEEFGTDLSKKTEELMELLATFSKRREIRGVAAENGLDEYLFHQAFVSFRKYIAESESLEPDLHIVLSDILVGGGHVDDILPYFLEHARRVFPHLDCIEDLKKISDLTDPANWYPGARAVDRKIIFHAGPTNSGKTYHALESFSKAETGVYCGPLKLLANEVHRKTNERGIKCDLITGEERRFADPQGHPSGHVACTVEMTSTTQPYDIAVIDEIQMLRDPSRGWAWTRALLGISAKEIHLCGEEAAIPLLNELLTSTGESMEVRRYKRLMPLKILDKSLDSLENIRPGDCIVAFSKNDIFTLSRKLEEMGHECAVIYGSLPPGTKLGQAEKFNDSEDTCKILVATDSIGMGLNLSIRRVIFYSVTKPMIKEDGEKEISTISTSQALQIAGRAGRYGMDYEQGEATTFYPRDLPVLKEILAAKVEPIEACGLHPTAEQIELFAYHLPDATLSNLIDIFVSLSKVDSNYFVCNIDDFKFLADMIQHIPLNLRTRYVFCCAPINKKHAFICTAFLKFARRYSQNQPLTFEWFSRQVDWPLAVPRNLRDLMHLEAVHDVMDVYLWFSYRFMDMFPHGEMVREIQRKLDDIIKEGVIHITKLIHASEKKMDDVANLPDDEIERKKSLSKKGSPPPKNDGSYVKSGWSPKLSDTLIKEGVISPEMLQMLKKEFQTADYKKKRSSTRNTKGKNDYQYK